ncbi:MAG TPA: aconitate hydratase AcnA [Thermoflexales bacterium]|nr:aconitate hydratase AcnA [Thermoflexales bacterium]HQW36071.1 aconitate hydratase AcnA [Thermoflexales bacterium]
MSKNPFENTATTLKAGDATLKIYSLAALEKSGAGAISKLPFSMKVMLEQALRQCDGFLTTEEDVRRIAKWDAKNVSPTDLPFRPARVILQDFSGVPCLVDLAAMRAALAKKGADPKKVNPQVPVDMVIDHSVQVDFFGSPDAFQKNLDIEFERNNERYKFAKWGQNAFQNFGVVPPGTGIVHQVNLEYLARVTMVKDGVAFPDTLVGTDSHTTMINGLGVVGWGVGGIEAEAVMVGQPLSMTMPEVIGFKLSGALREGVTATDLTLTIVQMLRKKGVVEKFVEFYGTGLSSMSLADRATIANMAPEYGATMGFFPIDEETLRYLRGSNRADAAVLTEAYAKAQGLFRTDDTPDPVFTDTLELDLSTVEPSVAGPKRPQDRVPLSQVKKTFNAALTAPTKDRGFGLKEEELGKIATVKLDDGRQTMDDGNVHRLSSIVLKHGAVVIAAITSCTNTSNPSVMLGAGLLAKKAVEKGLKVPAYVKTSLAPGSKVVKEYLTDANLLEPLAKLGFNIVGYGCTTCIGNSGPLPTMVANAVTESAIVTSAVISGNRNFEGRVHPLVKANYLASPPLVVAYALAGSTEVDLTTEPIGTGKDGKPVYLKDIWPNQKEIADAVAAHIRPEMFKEQYGGVRAGTEAWQKIGGAEGDLYAWDDDSTYIQEPPYFEDFELTPKPIESVITAKVLGLFGDSITTDHISPAGDIALNSPAGAYLTGKGVSKADFNQYGARRGNDRIMTRGTFANIRLKNLLVPGVEGGVTKYFDDGGRRTEDGAVSGLPSPVMSIYDAAMKYKASGTPLVVLAGKEYGTGSSRDWAAKGSLLLGVRAVIAESYERIHRNNLVGMGVLPLQFLPGESATSLGLKGDESYTIFIPQDIKARQLLAVLVQPADGRPDFTFFATARLDTPVEVNYYQNGGILQTVLRGMVKG